MTRLIIPRGRLYGGKFGCLDSLLTRGRFIWRDIFAGLSIKSSQRSVAANSGKSSFRNYVYSLMTWQLILGSQPCHPRIICSRNDMAANSGTTVILGLAATESLLRTLFVFACFSSTATKLKLAGACFWCLCVDDALRRPKVRQCGVDGNDHKRQKQSKRMEASGMQSYKAENRQRIAYDIECIDDINFFIAIGMKRSC
jgi:hypothetical protein